MVHKDMMYIYIYTYMYIHNIHMCACVWESKSLLLNLPILKSHPREASRKPYSTSKNAALYKATQKMELETISNYHFCHFQEMLGSTCRRKAVRKHWNKNTNPKHPVTWTRFCRLKVINISNLNLPFFFRLRDFKLPGLTKSERSSFNRTCRNELTFRHFFEHMNFCVMLTQGWRIDNGRTI